MTDYGNFDTFDSTFSGIQTIFFLIFGIILCLFLYKIIDYFISATAEEQEVQARLIDKTTSVSSHMSGTEGHYFSSTNYYLIFEMETGERKNFEVSKGVYLDYVVGDSGTLKYKRKIFVDFEINNPN